MAWTEQKASGNYTGYYRDAAGKKRSAGTSVSQDAALKEAQKMAAKIDSGDFTDPTAGNKKLDDYFENRWILRRRLEINGRATYRSHYRAGIKKRFGKVRVNRITRTMVQDWIDDMEKAGVSARTIHARYACLQVILAAKRGVSAINDGLRETNPCLGVTLPVQVEREVQIYTPDQVDRLVAALDPWWRLMVLFDTDTGLRWGELIALRPCDVDLQRHTVAVRRTIIEVDKESTGTGTPFANKEYPKNKKGRLVGITPEVAQMLEFHIRSRKLKKTDLLFAMPVLKTDAKGHTILVPEVARTDVWQEGLPISRSYFRILWRRAVREAKVPMRRRHDLRASFISWLCDDQSLSQQQIMETVGHRDWKTTRRYAKALDGTQQAAVAAIADIRQRFRNEIAAEEHGNEAPGA